MLTATFEKLTMGAMRRAIELVIAVALAACGKDPATPPGDGSPDPDNDGSAIDPTDKRRPEFVSSTPVDDDFDRPTNQTMTVVFSEPIKASTVTDASFYMQAVGTTTKIPGTIMVDGDTATFVPSIELPAETRFNFTIEPTIEDLNGNTLLADKTLRFNTVHRRRVFVTSVTGSARLQLFPGSGGKIGLQGGDAACQARAIAANLDGAFVAWLSDSTHDAFCRVQGLTGKRIDNCGQATLPNQAGPWVRVDQLPWADTIEQLANANNLPRIFSPPALTELGQLAPLSFFSNTSLDGTLNVNSCSNWTSNSSILSMTYGGSRTTGSFWTNWGNLISGCATSSALLCIEVNQLVLIPNLPFPAPTGKRAFITGGSVPGDLGSSLLANGQTGIAAGDEICRAEAVTGALPNPNAFKAWLSDGTTSAASRFTSNGPWTRIDGIRIADSLADLIDARLATTLDQDTGGGYAVGAQVWTGTLSTGTDSGSNCTSWTAGTGVLGTVGRANNSDGHWTRDATVDCAQTHRLFCLED